MSDNETQPANDQQEQAPQPVQQQTEDRDGLGDAGKKALADERKARRDADKRAKELADKLAQFEDANKSETEKLADRASKSEQAYADLLGRHNNLLRDQAIATAAANAQATDAETVTLYLREAVQVDDSGEVQGLDKALRDLQQRKPHLFRTTPAGSRDAAASTTPPALNSTALEDALRAAVGAR